MGHHSHILSLGNIHSHSVVIALVGMSMSSMMVHMSSSLVGNSHVHSSLVGSSLDGCSYVHSSLDGCNHSCMILAAGCSCSSREEGF